MLSCSAKMQSITHTFDAKNESSPTFLILDYSYLYYQKLNFYVKAMKSSLVSLLNNFPITLTYFVSSTIIPLAHELQNLLTFTSLSAGLLIKSFFVHGLPTQTFSQKSFGFSVKGARETKGTILSSVRILFGMEGFFGGENYEQILPLGM